MDDRLSLFIEYWRQKIDMLYVDDEATCSTDDYKKGMMLALVDAEIFRDFPPEIIANWMKQLREESNGVR